MPLGLHRAASDWAQAQASRRLEATADRAAGERGDLRTAQAELAGSVADLQAARERGDLYLVEPADPSAPEVCPFRGLAPFDAVHSAYFFGRERLVAGLVARVVGSTLLAVVGPSGSGKSSVLRAGLLPALANGMLPGSQRWRQVLIRPGEHPLAATQRALARLAPGEGQGDGADPLAAALGSLAPDERLVLAVDQFEEAFTACRDEDERAAFTDALVRAADDTDQRVVVVLAIRADFYGRCAEYPSLSAQISANNVLVGPMSRKELRRAIELPARKAGLRVEPGLVSALVDDVAGQPGGLPLLSTALLELWQERSGRTLREASYAASGGVSGAVARLAEGAYRRLSEPERERARAILLRLADAEESALVRRRVALSELEVERDEDAAGALAVLTESRLVTIDEAAVEVAHEALLREWPRLRRWLEEDAEGRRLHQHLIHAAAEWHGSEHDPAELYRGARLASALDWAASHDPELNELERAFLEESQAASEREAERQRRTNRRLRTLLAGVGVLLAAAVIAGVIALSERQGARDAATAETAQRLGAQALTEDRLDRALMLANTGVALDDSPATRSSLLSTLLRSPAALGVLDGDTGRPQALALSPDGSTLAVGDGQGQLSLFDTETRQQIGDHQLPGRALVARLRPPGRLARDPHERHARAPERVPPDRRPEHSAGAKLRLARPPSGRPRIVLLPHRRLCPGRAKLGGQLFDRGLRLLGARVPAAFRRPHRLPARTGRPRRPQVLQDPADLDRGRAPARLDRDRRGRRRAHLRDRRGDAARPGPLSGERFQHRRQPRRAHPRVRAGGGGGVRLLDLASGRVRTLAYPEGDFGVGAFSPDGRTLSTWDEDGNVSLWDLDTGALTQTFELPAPSGRQVFSPDGRTLYTAGADTTAMIWDVEGDGRLLRPFRTDTDTYPFQPGPPSFATSPDGRTLAVAGEDGQVDLIDGETLRRTGGFEAFPGRSLPAIEYSPDGRRLAVAGRDGGLGLWDPGPGSESARSSARPAARDRGARCSRSAREACSLRQAPGYRTRVHDPRRRTDLGHRRAEADPAAAAPGAPPARPGLRPRRLATRDRDPFRRRGSRSAQRRAPRLAADLRGAARPR